MKNKAETFFEPTADVLRRANEILNEYSVIIEPADDGAFVGYAVELPGVVAGGKTHAECIRELQFGLETVVASYLTDNAEPPRAHRREKRVEQVNVRFTARERLLLEQESVKQGFRGVGDLIRKEMLRSLRASA